MNQIYTPELRDVLEVFQVYECKGEYFDLSRKPIYRQSFTVGVTMENEGYMITDKCINCQKCYDICLQKCIHLSSQSFMIEQHHCLHCGKCQEVCPVHAINKRGGENAKERYAYQTNC